MPDPRDTNLADRWLDIEEIRLITDLRVMHAKIDELYHLVLRLKERHAGEQIQSDADPAVLTEDINQVDEIYLWFVKLKEELEKRGRQG
ncbi:MAG: hypothetical protein DMG68_21595 [Acidobacteria bacterium]|nr:MAG: hypothetical protein DMG68_21595 [Acidobacteriota bacterium]